VSALVERTGRLDAIKRSNWPAAVAASAISRNEAGGGVLDHVAQRRSLKLLAEKDG
jgi:hypothetical protein